MPAEQVDTVIIGAGVVGLAIARALALGGREVIVVEAESTIGTGTSSRNSEVIHAGIYYPPGSLKAKLCVAGRRALYPFLAEHGIAHRLFRNQAQTPRARPARARFPHPGPDRPRRCAPRQSLRHRVAGPHRLARDRQRCTRPARRLTHGPEV